MAGNVDLAAAIALLVQAINDMPRAAAPSPKVFDPFASNAAFDLSSRSGSSAYATISAPLDDIWNGDTSTFPSFVNEPNEFNNSLPLVNIISSQLLAINAPSIVFSETPALATDQEPATIWPAT